MLTLVNNDEGDWEGLYRDGFLIREGHSLSAHHVLEAIGLKFENIYNVDLSELGCLPETLSELPFDEKYRIPGEGRFGRV